MGGGEKGEMNGFRMKTQNEEKASRKKKMLDRKQSHSEKAELQSLKPSYFHAHPIPGTKLSLHRLPTFKKAVYSGG